MSSRPAPGSHALAAQALRNHYTLPLLFLLLLVCLAACAPRTGVPDYAQQRNWAYFAEGAGKAADVFLVCPTVDFGRDGHTNMPLEDALRARFLGALRMERGIYDGACRLFAPYYRQATLRVYRNGESGGNGGSGAKNVRERALRLAYGDVRAAFRRYLEYENRGRPLVLAGFSQGGDMVIRLLKEFFPRGDGGRLVCAYVQGWHFSRAEQRAWPGIRPATGEIDLGVLVAINTEAPRLTTSLAVPEDSCGINPLNWKTDGTPASPSENPGACFTDCQGRIVREIPAFCGAYLDTRRGVVKVPDVDEAAYPPLLDLLAPGEFHCYDYQFFYRALQRNVARRVASFVQNRRLSGNVF